MFEIFKAYNFSESVLQDLAASLDKQSGKLFESISHQILIDREKLILQKKNLSTCPNITVNLNSEIIEWGESKFKLHTSETTPISIAKNPNLAYFDESLLQFPLKFRQWYKGDYFYPFGMKGKKKISDFFTALKIPLIKKSTIPILENGNGDIIWVAGYRIDDRYKVSSSSKKVIIFEKY